jgi:hypothetical protein
MLYIILLLFTAQSENSLNSTTTYSPSCLGTEYIHTTSIHVLIRLLVFSELGWLAKTVTPIQSKDFLRAECKIIGEPVKYGLEELLELLLNG